MRKIICFILAVFALTVFAVGCGSENDAAEQSDTGITAYGTGTYYISGENDDEAAFAEIWVVDGEVVYHGYSNNYDGKGSYGIWPGETEEYDSPIEYSEFYGKTAEQVIATLEADGYDVTVTET
ncbi:MAG: hypothetical protein LUD44_04045 [Firmicutes bacterium]|nr:hypothetical protein [Bacillota bacterium]